MLASCLNFPSLSQPEQWRIPKFPQEIWNIGGIEHEVKFRDTGSLIQITTDAKNRPEQQGFSCALSLIPGKYNHWSWADHQRLNEGTLRPNHLVLGLEDLSVGKEALLNPFAFMEQLIPWVISNRARIGVDDIRASAVPESVFAEMLEARGFIPGVDTFYRNEPRIEYVHSPFSQCIARLTGRIFQKQ